MKRLICEVCGGNEFQRTDNGMFQCNFCGCQYTIEQAKTIVAGTVEIVHGQKELLSSINSADALGKLGDYVGMMSAYKDIEKKYANEYLYWKSLMQSICYVLLHSESLDYTHTSVGCAKVTQWLLQAYNNALKICNESEAVKLKDYFENFCDEWITKCLTGEFDLIKSFTYYGLMDSELVTFCQTFPGANVLLEESERNVRSIIEAGINLDKKGKWCLYDYSGVHYKQRVDYDGTRYSLHIGPLFLIGKRYVYGYNCDGIATAQVNLEKPFNYLEAKK